MKRLKFGLIILLLFLPTVSFALEETLKDNTDQLSHKKILKLQITASKNSDDIIKLKDNLKTIELKSSKNSEDATKLQKQLIRVESSSKIQKETSESIFQSTTLLVTIACCGLAFIGALITIGAIILGLYINNAERKIIKIRDESSEILDKIKNVKNDVEQIRKNIHSNIGNIYQQIKREETIDLLNRLVKVPNDIANIVDLLVSRDLEEEDYALLKEGYLAADTHFKDYYLALFCQHFLHYFVLETDQEMVTQRRAHYSLYFSDAFTNDLIKSSYDFITGLMTLDLLKSKNEINSFIKGLTTVDTEKRYLVVTELFNALQTSKNQMNFYCIIDDKHMEIKRSIGKLIVETYIDKTLPGQEQKRLLEIKDKIES